MVAVVSLAGCAAAQPNVQPGPRSANAASVAKAPAAKTQATKGQVAKVPAAGAGTTPSALGRVRIRAGSMLPNFAVGLYCQVRELGRAPRRGEVVVFRSSSDPNKWWIKRVVGLGGETVALKNRQLLVNGKAVPRKAVAGPCRVSISSTERVSCVAYDETLGGVTYRIIHEKGRSPTDVKAVVVPAGHVYLLGDNRDNSHDSRSFGAITAKYVIGGLRCGAPRSGDR